MKNYLIFVLLVCTTMAYGQRVQFDIGTTIGSGVMKFKRGTNINESEKAFGVIVNHNPRIITKDFYLAVVSKIDGQFYLRSKLETIYFKGETNFDYLVQCFGCPLGPLNYVGEVNRKQIAFDILIEYRIIEKENWNIYFNSGISLIKVLPSSEPYIGRQYGKTTVVTNLGGTYWMKPYLGINGSIGYRIPSYGDQGYGSLPKASISKCFLSIGVSLTRKNKSS